MLEVKLGYAIYYIQDAVCVPHVFPFQEGISGPHWNFEGYAESKYLHDSRHEWWRDRIKKVNPKNITTSNIVDEVRKIADLVHQFPVIFLAQNNIWYRSENGKYNTIHIEEYSQSTVPCITELERRGFDISDDHIARAMEIAAAIVKGAAIYVFAEQPKKPIWEEMLDNISNFLKRVTEELSRNIEKKFQEEMEKLEEKMRRESERELKQCCAVQSVCGSAFISDLDMVRDFRDNTLSKNIIGKIFINFYYYKLSPFIVMFVSKYPPLNVTVKEIFVKPVIEIIKFYNDIKKQGGYYVKLSKVWCFY